MYSSKKAPDGPAKHIASIREAMAGNNYIEALNLSEEASEKYPEQTGFVQLVGENQLKLGRVEEAKRSFQRAIKLDPKEVKPHLSLADLYFEQGKYVYAALSYSDAVYLDSDIGPAGNLIVDLRENYHVFCSAVMYPVVPKGILLLRLIPSAVHTFEDIDETLAAFDAVHQKLKQGAYDNLDVPSVV